MNNFNFSITLYGSIYKYNKEQSKLHNTLNINERINLKKDVKQFCSYFNIPFFIILPKSRNKKCICLYYTEKEKQNLFNLFKK